MNSKPLMIVTMTNAVGQNVENEGAVVQRICSSFFISSQDELIGWESSRRLSVRLLTLSNMNISAAGRPNSTGKFYFTCR